MDRDIRSHAAASGTGSRLPFPPFSRGFLLFLAFLAPAGAGLPGASLPAQAGGEAAAPAGEGKAERPRGLLEVVKLEGRREKEARDRKIREDILKLGIYTDPDLAFVQRKRREILAQGPAAVPLLIEAMEKVSGEQTRINAGRAAADLLARIRDPAVEDLVNEALRRMLDSTYELVRANAVRCIGARGLVSFLDRVKENLKSRDKDLLAETLLCLGRLKAEDTPGLAVPFLKHPSAKVRTAALRALLLCGREDEEAPPRAAETLAEAGEIPVQEAAMDYLERFGTDACVPTLTQLYKSHRLRRKEAPRLLRVITRIARRSSSGEVKAEVKALFKSLLDEADFETVRLAAHDLFELGDDAGLKVLTGHLDRLIERHGNSEYYFRRGEVYLRFQRYKEARRDFLDGLRKDRKAERYGLDKAYIALARCYAAEGRFAEAERYLKKLQDTERSSLPGRYPEFEKMAADDRYGKVFREKPPP